MLINPLGKIVGPTAMYSGYVFMIFGIIAIYFSPVSLVLVLAGAAMVFSYAESIINSEKKTYQVRIRLFGFLKIGKEKTFQSGQYTEVKPFKGGYGTYSRGGRIHVTSVDDYRVYLRSRDNNMKVTIGIFESEENAKIQAGKVEEIIRLL